MKPLFIIKKPSLATRIRLNQILIFLVISLIALTLAAFIIWLPLYSECCYYQHQKKLLVPAQSQMRSDSLIQEEKTVRQRLAKYATSRVQAPLNLLKNIQKICNATDTILEYYQYDGKSIELTLCNTQTKSITQAVSLLQKDPLCAALAIQQLEHTTPHYRAKVAGACLPT